MEIRWVLDREDDLDPENLLADIEIGDKFEKIVIKEAFIDSWLEAISRCLSEIGDLDVCKVRILEESNPLVLSSSDKGSELRFGEQEISIPSIDALRMAAQQACKTLIVELERLGIPRVHSIHCDLSGILGRLSRAAR